jgi:hypothetical protein
MNMSRCPRCGVKLGNFLYADVCPHCDEGLRHNAKPLVPARQPAPLKERRWPVRIFSSILRLVES